MCKVNERWKTVIHSEQNMADAMREFVEDYISLVNFWKETEENQDDWVHIDEVVAEREELIASFRAEEEKLEKKVSELELQLQEKMEQIAYLESQLNKIQEDLDSVPVDEEPPKPREVKRLLVKKKKKLIAKSK